jgi:hypothetical protein
VAITVTSVNDAPTGTNAIINVVEDGSRSFAAVDFGFADASDSPANAFNQVIITSLPLAGTLRLSGVAVTEGQAIAVANLGNLVYAPAANGNGAGYASFGFKVRDNGGTANGGVDTSVNANTITFNVTAVNDAPVITDTNLNLATVDPVTGNPAGAVGSLVSSFMGGVSDMDAGALRGMAITGIDTSQGGMGFSGLTAHNSRLPRIFNTEHCQCSDEANH